MYHFTNDCFEIKTDVRPCSLHESIDQSSRSVQYIILFRLISKMFMAFSKATSRKKGNVQCLSVRQTFRRGLKHFRKNVIGVRP